MGRRASNQQSGSERPGHNMCLPLLLASCNLERQAQFINFITQDRLVLFIQQQRQAQDRYSQLL